MLTLVLRHGDDIARPWMRRGSCGCAASEARTRCFKSRGRRHRIDRVREPFHDDGQLAKTRRAHLALADMALDVAPFGSETAVPVRIRRASRRSCRGDPWSWPQAPAQGPERGADTSLDRTERRRQAFGDLGLGEPFEVGQFERGPLVGGQRDRAPRGSARYCSPAISASGGASE